MSNPDMTLYLAESFLLMASADFSYCAFILQIRNS